MVTTGTLASTASCSAGAMASTSFGLMTMPSTPLVIAASMSAVCLVDGTWPSLSMISMSPSLSASALISFIMWTKNGKFSPGSEARMTSFLSADEADPAKAVASTSATAVAAPMRAKPPNLSGLLNM